MEKRIRINISQKNDEAIKKLMKQKNISYSNALNLMLDNSFLIPAKEKDE